VVATGRHAGCMALHLIAKHHAGTLNERESAVRLSDVEQRALEAWWKRGPNSDERVTAETVFRRMRSGGLWLACDCVDGAMPLLSVFRRDGELFLRRMPDRPLHRADCLYFREHPAHGPAESISHDALKDGLRRKPLRPPSFYELDSPIGLPMPRRTSATTRAGDIAALDSSAKHTVLCIRFAAQMTAIAFTMNPSELGRFRDVAVVYLPSLRTKFRVKRAQCTHPLPRPNRRRKRSHGRELGGRTDERRTRPR
jgi:hypothetical protein